MGENMDNIADDLASAREALQYWYDCIELCDCKPITLGKGDDADDNKVRAKLTVRLHDADEDKFTTARVTHDTSLSTSSKCLA